MKKRNILYISAIMLLTGCSKDADISNSTLSGNGEKTPLRINATLNTDKAGTRAEGSSFAIGDQLMVYLRHTTGGTGVGNYTYIDPVPDPDYANKLVIFTKGASGFTSTAYWDDFSDPSDASTDLRTSGHGLQSYYSYCYNGGTPISQTNATGVLTWEIFQDQSIPATVQQSDLLWSPEQATVTYAHNTAYTTDHGTLNIPYTHAMSEITVTVIAADGFSGSPLTSTVLTLNAMNTETQLDTRETTFTPLIQTTESKLKNITMCGATYTTGLTRNYTAIVAPGTKLKEGNLLLNITNADRNNYTVNITGDMVDYSHWASGHSAGQYGNLDSDGHNCVITQPGKNYHLDVTIKKSAVQAHSTLANWTDVSATANGDIYFPNDCEVILDDSYTGGVPNVNVEAIDKNQFIDGASFSLFRVQATDYNTDNLGNNSEAPKDYAYATRTNNHYTFETISSFKNTNVDPDDYWTNAPELYWPNNSYKFYYRALAKFNSVDAGANNITYVGAGDRSTKGTSVSQGTIGEGHDILWGTTPKHYGSASQKIYKRGYPIPPRTHGVPIVFEHALSKVSFTLETTSDAAATVNLSEASFVVSGLYTSGTILIDNGEISNRGVVGGTTISATATVSPGISTTLISDLIVVPQTFDVSDKITITLPSENNAVYSIPLANCTVSGGNTSSAWERGKDYSYTIHVEKEKVQLKVLVKDWDEVTGSGNAALEW